MKAFHLSFLLVLIIVLTEVEAQRRFGRRRIGGARRIGRPFGRRLGRRPGIGLAFAGGYIAGASRRNYYTNNYYYNTCDPYGYNSYYNYNQCSGYYYGKRRRRSVGSDIDTEIEELYTELAAIDTEQCGFLLLCELAHKPVPDLDELELTILAPYRADGPSDGTNYGNYNEAVWRGKNGETCVEKYSLCESTAAEIMETIRKVEAEVLEELPEDKVTESPQPDLPVDEDENNDYIL